MSNSKATNVDAAEIAKFDAVASDWWDADGSFRPLHDLNPVRLAFVQQHVEVARARVLDVGCGGGLLSEAMAGEGGSVLGIDASSGAIRAASAQAQSSGSGASYGQTTVEAVVAESPANFDVVTCMEMLEHVPDPAAVVAACAACLKPGGWLVASTLNRTFKAFALGIVAAEHVLQLLPKGTHEYARFIRPSELGRWARASGLSMVSVAGLDYDPLRRHAELRADVSVNYLAAFQKV